MTKSKKKSKMPPPNLPFAVGPTVVTHLKIPNVPLPAKPTNSTAKKRANQKPLEDPIDAHARKGNRQALRSQSTKAELEWSKYPPWHPLLSILVNHVVFRLEEGDMSFLQYAKLFTLNRRLDRMFYKYQFYTTNHLWKLLHYVGPKLEHQLRLSAIDWKTQPHPPPAPDYARNLFRVTDFVKRLSVIDGDMGSPEHRQGMMPINCVTLQILERYRPEAQKWFCPNLTSLRWSANSDTFLKYLLQGRWLSPDVRELHLSVGDQVTVDCLVSLLVLLPHKFEHIKNLRKLTLSGKAFDDPKVVERLKTFVAHLSELTSFYCFEARRINSLLVSALQLPQLEKLSWCNQYMAAHQDDEDSEPKLGSVRPQDNLMATTFGSSWVGLAPAVTGAPLGMFQSLRVLELQAPFADLVILLGSLPVDNRVVYLSLKTHVLGTTEVLVLNSLIADRVSENVRDIHLSLRLGVDSLFLHLRERNAEEVVDPKELDFSSKQLAIKREASLQRTLQNVKGLPPDITMRSEVFDVFCKFIREADAHASKPFLLLQCFDLIRVLECRKRHSRPAVSSAFWERLQKGHKKAAYNPSGGTATNTITEPVLDNGSPVLERISDETLLENARSCLEQVIKASDISEVEGDLRGDVAEAYEIVNAASLRPFRTHRPAMEPLSWQAFRPIYRCRKQLRKLSVEVDKVFDVNLCDSDLEDMMKTWSRAARHEDQTCSIIQTIVLKMNERNPDDYYVEPAEQRSSSETGGPDISENAGETSIVTPKDKEFWLGSGLKFRPSPDAQENRESVDERFPPNCTLRGIAALTHTLQDSLREVYIPFNALPGSGFISGGYMLDDWPPFSPGLERFHLSPYSRLPVLAQLRDQIAPGMEQQWPVAEFVIPACHAHQNALPNWVRLHALRRYIWRLRKHRAERDVQETRKREAREAMEARKEKPVPRTHESSVGPLQPARKRAREEDEDSSPSEEGHSGKKPRHEYNLDFASARHSSTGHQDDAGASDAIPTQRVAIPVRAGTPHTNISATSGPSGIESGDSTGPPSSSPSRASSPGIVPPLPVQGIKRRRDDDDDSSARDRHASFSKRARN